MCQPSHIIVIKHTLFSDFLKRSQLSLSQDCCYRYVKFDTFHPAVDRGLPVTRVISRVVLQQLLAETAFGMAGEDLVLNDQTVVDYQHEVRSPRPAKYTAVCNMIVAVNIWHLSYVV